MWELVECMRILPLDRLVLLVPLEEAEYDAFRMEAQARLLAVPGAPPLPPYRPDPRIKSPRMGSTRLKALIYYTRVDQGWQPTFVWLESQILRITRLAGFRDKVYVALKHALRPAITHLTSTDASSAVAPD